MSIPINVTVVYSPAAREVLEVAVVLPPDATVIGAILASGFAGRCPDIELKTAVMGVWGASALWISPY